MDLDAICADILKHYHAVDSATSAFGKRAGLSCPPGCGQCCETPDIQATELEMLPMARSITQTGKTETLGDLSRGTCVFFEPGPGPGAGRCNAYELRPLVCRLFGFAARRSKSGRAELASCRVHQTQSPEGLKRALLLAGEAPQFQDEFTRLAGLEPGIGWELLPINVALKRALERVYLHKMRSDP
jgi:Fe-S-cluster containining protein